MNPDHLKILEKGVDAWNAWRIKEFFTPPAIGADFRKPDLNGADLRKRDLSEVNLSFTDLRRADLSGAILFRTNLNKANLRRANLSRANLSRAQLHEADLIWADLRRAILKGAELNGADLRTADLRRADLNEAILFRANLTEADLTETILFRANLSRANLFKAHLRRADLRRSDVTEASLHRAILCGADLNKANLTEADIRDADLTGCRIYGISAWGLKLNENTKQRNLIITPRDEPEITVDNIEVAQFVYLLLHNEKIRDAIDTIGKKGVLLLGRFTEGRIAVLERLREALRNRGFLPMILNFDKPMTKNFTETVRILAGMSRFVIADITNPRSSPLELQATVPECMVPFVPILDRNDELEPFSMLRDLQIAYPDRVLDVIRYPSVGRLIEVLDTEIIKPAQTRFADLLARKAAGLRVRDV